MRCFNRLGILTCEHGGIELPTRGFSVSYWGARCPNCITVHNGAQLIDANFTQPSAVSMNRYRHAGWKPSALRNGGEVEPDLERLQGPGQIEGTLCAVTHVEMRRSARVRTVIDFLFEAVASASMTLRQQYFN